MIPIAFDVENHADKPNEANRSIPGSHCPSERLASYSLYAKLSKLHKVNQLGKFDQFVDEPIGDSCPLF